PGATADRTINSDALAQAIRERGFDGVALVEGLDAARLLLEASPAAGVGGAILVCGARDPGLPALARSLVR
ncbi:MAG: hypothetical protein IJP66_08590, partial [Kiritimatiellae bacterium]|nr:hypothetical protein [Kiritimatiellia bacterium]